MTQVSSFILFRKQEIDCACAIAVIILSSLNQPYWIPQAVAVPEAGAGRKIDFFGQQQNESESEKEKDMAWERESTTGGDQIKHGVIWEAKQWGNKDTETSSKRTMVAKDSCKRTSKYAGRRGVNQRGASRDNRGSGGRVRDSERSFPQVCVCPAREEVTNG